MMFKCPVCQQIHVVPDKYDNKDFVCLNPSDGANAKTFQDVEPTDLLTRNEYLKNRRSTKVDEVRSATCTIHGPGYRADGEKVGPLTKLNY